MELLEKLKMDNRSQALWGGSGTQPSKAVPDQSQLVPMLGFTIDNQNVLQTEDALARAMQATRIGQQKGHSGDTKKAELILTSPSAIGNPDESISKTKVQTLTSASNSGNLTTDTEPRAEAKRSRQQKQGLMTGKPPWNTTIVSAQTPGLIQPPPLSTVPAPSIDMKALDLWIHPKAILEAYSYTTESPSTDEVNTSLAKVDGNEVCRRCDKRFIFKEIAWDKISEDNCVHHPGKFSVIVEGKRLFDGRQMKVWSCCFKRGFEPGCTIGPTHVVELHDVGRLAALCPFAATPEATSVNDESKIQKAIALDCEMSFTKYGLTVSRMTILSVPGAKTLVDTYIREPYPGIHFMDYNTRYSGVTHENLWPKDPANSLPVLDGIVAAREKLWEYCDKNTIIIGHGLDHDLKCLRVLHPKIIDTALLYSTRLGVKYRLKKLAEDELKWSIQADDTNSSTGHDSVEDCRTCIELVLKFLQRPRIAAESAASEVPD